MQSLPEQINSSRVKKWKCKESEFSFLLSSKSKHPVDTPEFSLATISGPHGWLLTSKLTALPVFPASKRWTQTGPRPCTGWPWCCSIPQEDTSLHLCNQTRKVPKHQLLAKPLRRGDVGNRVREMQSPTRAPRFHRARIRKEVSLIFYTNAIKSYHFNFPKFFTPLHNHESSIKYLHAPAPPFFREGNGTPPQYSCLENPVDGGAWWAAVHGVAKSRTRLNDFTFTFHFAALEKEMATHSSVLAWRIPGMGSQSRTRLKWLSSSPPFLTTYTQQ